MKQLLMTLLLVLGLLFWGWSTQVLWLGMLLSTVVLAGFTFKDRYDFEASSFYQIANLVGLIVAAIFVFYWLDDRASKAIMPTLRLLPLALLPLLLMQYVSKQTKVPVSALLFFQRGQSVTLEWFDVSVLFLFTSLFSAGALPHEGIAYFTGVSALILALLLVLYSHQYATTNTILILVFLSAEALGLGLIYGMNDLQSRLEAKINAWILSYHDGSKASTAIGSVGRLKLSDEIIFRVQSDQRFSTPILLREGTYQRYIRNTWYGGAWTDQDIPLVKTSWQLMDTNKPLKGMTIYQSFDGEPKPLSLPSGTAWISNFAADSLRMRQGGRVEAQLPPPFAAFKVSYTGINRSHKDVSRSDFDIPKSEAVSIAKYAKSLDLYRIKYEQGTSQAMQILHDDLSNHFMYSTWLEKSNKDSSQTALTHFLWQSKAGHCEYFATVTVLVLREIGIAARYAVGFSMSEHDHDLYVVRGRDAHAWAVAFVDGQWVNVDNTPANWFAIENQGASVWQGFTDVLSSWVFVFKKWRYSDDEKDTTFWYGLLAMMFIFLAYRVLRRVKTLEPSETGQHEVVDEDWLSLEQALADAGYVRHQGETVSAWFARIKEGQWQEIAALYNQYLYSKNGLNKAMLQAFERNKQHIRRSLHEER